MFDIEKNIDDMLLEQEYYIDPSSDVIVPITKPSLSEYDGEEPYGYNE